MTGKPDFNDLSPDDRATATALRESFAALTLDRPVPTPVPGRPTGRARWSLAAAAAAATVVAGAALLLPEAASPAWASVPTAPTSDDVTEAVAACGANLGGGLGTLEGSGSVAAPADGSTSTGTFEGSTGGAAPSGAGADDAVPTPPTTLPPLQALDIRGTGALAVYGDAEWQISCLLYEADGTWTSGGLTVTERLDNATPGLTASSSTVRSDGQTVSTLGGSTAPGATTVTITLASGTEAEATVVDGQYVAWFPEPIGAAAPVVRQFDAAGAELSTR
jgi:hypothetical protein